MADISTCKAMTDHFEGIDKLVKEAPHTDGAPNFRRVRNIILFVIGAIIYTYIYINR